MTETIQDQLTALRKEVDRLTRIQQPKDRQITQQQRTIDGLNRRISAMATQIASLSTSISRLR